MEHIIITCWFGAGTISHIYWWDRLTEGKWDGPSIPLFLLTLFQASIFGPLTFILEGFLYFLTHK